MGLEYVFPEGRCFLVSVMITILGPERIHLTLRSPGRLDRTAIGEPIIGAEVETFHVVGRKSRLLGGRFPFMDGNEIFKFFFFKKKS